ncbi:MAG: prephenate dehydrogenase [Actinomycetales bacterium]|nr:prephenate dehydrogenase [Actinomycetales bacterium]
MVRSVRIVGAGLIGTSIGLALAAKNIAVEMIDVDSRNQALAQDLTGGVSIAEPELIILATPLRSLSQVIDEQYKLNPNSTFMDVCSVKVEPLQKVKASKLPLKQFIGTHPMAGREVGGAESARADLFLSRSWIITPDSQSDPEAVTKVKWLVQLLGATCVELDAASHDAAVARVSHLPQITATLLASSLHGVAPDWLDLAGAGLRDTTRIAASDENLWKEIISSNSQEIKSLLSNLHTELGEIIDAVDDQEKIAAFMRKGREGRKLIPGKHGGKAREYTYVPIVIDDKPGQLGAIFNECAAMSVNVEDLVIEHSPGQLNALITLALSADDAVKLSNHLSSIGWNVHPVRN